MGKSRGDLSCTRGGDPENKEKYKEDKDEYEDEMDFEDVWTNHRNPRPLHKICRKGAQERINQENLPNLVKFSKV